MTNKKLADAAWEWMNEARKHLKVIEKLADKEMKSAVSLSDKLEADSYRKAARQGEHDVIAIFTHNRNVSEPRRR